MSLPAIKALACDVFETVVGTHENLVCDIASCGAAQGFDLDWEWVVDLWRNERREWIEKIKRHEAPWMSLDAIHRLTLTEVLAQFEVRSLSEADLDHWSRAWHRLTPWPDAVPGLTRLRRKFIVAALSNGNMALLVNMAKYGGLPWDCILSAELARRYKPAPEVYLTAVGLLGLEPSEVLMVAAHPWDLRGAQAAGLCTALVHRPSAATPARTPTSDKWHVEAGDFNELADKLESS